MDRGRYNTFGGCGVAIVECIRLSAIELLRNENEFDARKLNKLTKVEISLTMYEAVDENWIPSLVKSQIFSLLDPRRGEIMTWKSGPVAYSA